MKSEYDVMAINFLKRIGAKMTISHISEGKTSYCSGFWKKSDMTGGWLYRVRIDRNHKTWSFNFSDSKANYINNERPTPYDVLACLTKYEPYGDVWDFANEYGYKINSRETYENTERIYKAVKKEYENVVRIFGDVIDELECIY